MLAIEALTELSRAFNPIPPPRMVENPQHCPECARQESRLQAASPNTLVMTDLLGNPVPMLTDDGFRYYLPGLARLAVEGSYLHTFLLALGPGRVAALNRREKIAVRRLLEAVRENSASTMDPTHLALLDRRVRALKR